jgi:hypothetical protein
MVIQVLETMTKEDERKREKLDSMQPILSSVCHTGLSGGAPDSVRCARLVRVNSPLSGLDDGVRLKFTGPSGGAPDCPVSHPRRTRRPREKQRGDVAIIHWTVRWCTGLSGEPTVASANSRSRNLRATHGLLQRSAGAPDSVWCANQPRGATVGYAKSGRRSHTGPSTGPSGGAPDCPVRHSTEGKDSLPC